MQICMSLARKILLAVGLLKEVWNCYPGCARTACAAASGPGSRQAAWGSRRDKG